MHLCLAAAGGNSLGERTSETRPAGPWLPWLAIAAFALLLILPALLSSLKLHDSFWIDWVWTDQFGDQLRRGNLYPRWLPGSHDGLGSPVFYYYPPLSFYPAGLLAALGVAPGVAIILTFALALAGAGAAMFAWARGWTDHPLAASLFFMAAPYHLADVYGRGALAEACAIAFIPLLALGLKRVSEGKGAALAAIAYGAMIATHLPLALLASLFLVAPYALVLTRGRPRALLAFAAPLAIGIGLSAVYLLPALLLEPYRDAAVLWSHDVLRPDHWLLLGNWAAPLDGMRLITLKVIAVIALPALVIAWRWRPLWAGYAILCCLIVAGLLPFFWDLPLIRSVQFPFRALPFAEFGFATALARVPDRRLAALLVLPALALSATFLLAPAPDGAPVAPAELARHPDVPENLPPGARPYSWPSRWALGLAAGHRAPVRQGDITVEPVFYFPAWRVTCAGADVPAFADPATGLLAHRGSGCTLALGWTGPEEAGAAISLLALLILLALIFRPRPRRDAPC
jgi:hypothetical protein